MTIVVKLFNQVFPNNPFSAGRHAINELEKKSSLCIQKYSNLSTEIQQEVDRNHFSRHLLYEHSRSK